MTIYGLYGITHDWGRLLTVMSAQGATAALGAIVTGEDIAVSAGAGKLTQYHERRDGALARLVETHHIVVLNHRDWAAKKAELGEEIWR
jgi:hypothetical protein